MPKMERVRELLSGLLTPDYVNQRMSAGWKPVAVVWEREARGGAQPAEPVEDVPFGLRISDECTHLEEHPDEREALIMMLELIIQDRPLSQVADELNKKGLRTRHDTKWTPGSVFDMLPRLIEVGPRIFTSEEWVVRRGRLMNVV